MRSAFKLAACAVLLSSCASTAPDGPSATALIRPSSGSQVSGTVKFTQVGARVRVDAEITALSPGLHGMHIHEKGDCTAADGTSAGPHFSAPGRKHGGPDSSERHAGDLGNVTANDSGKAALSIMVEGISVGKGTDGVVGRSVIVHAGPDDLKTDPTGNSGGRIGCGVIEG